MSLTVTRDTLLREIGRFTGWGRNPSDWSDNQQQDGRDILARALRKFYEPDPLPGEIHSHRWSFLRPLWDFHTKPSIGEYDLPEDFGGMNGDLVYVDSNAGTVKLRKIPMERMLLLRQLEQESLGYPTRYALNVLPSDGSEAQRNMLLLHPRPQSVHRLQGRYRSNPEGITSNRPYPLGGQPVGDALLAAAVCAADEVVNDTYGGPTWQLFLNRLRAAVSLDRQENFAGNLGYNSDPGMAPEMYDRQESAFTINGVSPTNDGGFYFDN